jgi:hypothetical protein
VCSNVPVINTFDALGGSKIPGRCIIRASSPLVRQEK